MFPFTNMEKVHVHSIYGTSNENGLEILRLCRERFPNGLLPYRKNLNACSDNCVRRNHFSLHGWMQFHTKTAETLNVEEPTLDMVVDRSITAHPWRTGSVLKASRQEMPLFEPRSRLWI